MYDHPSICADIIDVVEGKPVGEGSGPSKAQAKEEAAAQALEAIKSSRGH